jgi:hypothetical protein
LVLVGRGVQAGVIGFALAAFFGDFQYIELLYAQIMLIGAVRGVSTGEVAEREPESAERCAPSGPPTSARGAAPKLGPEGAR